MDSQRYTDLYATEAREHLRLLSRSILELESTDPVTAVGAAFRAAHTLKGIAAAMGHDRVVELAHALEDRLETVRSERGTADGVLIDELLAAADRLQEAVAVSLAPAAAAVRVARVRIRADAPLRGARAALVVQTCRRRGLVGSTRPESFDDADFDGEFRLEPAAGVSEAQVEEAVLGCGEVEAVVWEVPAEVASAPLAAGLPTQAVRVDPRRLDALAEGIGELTVLRGHLWPARDAGLEDTATRRAVALLTELQDEVLRLRMMPVALVFEQLPRVVRDVARAAGRSVQLVVEGTDIELDRGILEALHDPLVHLVRNAVDHGIEAPEERSAAGKPVRGEIRIEAERERTSVRIQITDDGRGVARARVADRAAAIGLTVKAADGLTDDDLLRLLSQPGLTTAERVTGLSGRGVGLDVVASRVRALGGAIAMRSKEGLGTTFTIRLPLTLALGQALRVRVAGEDYAIPLTHVCEVVELQDVHVSAVAGREALRVRDDLLPLVRLRQVLGGQGPGAEAAAVVAENGERRAALAVDELVGREQILVKGFTPARGTLPLFSGVTLLADGRPALVLDPLSVV